MKRLTFIIVWLVALAAIACGLLVYESDLLWKVQELNLFLYTSLFFKQQMVVPGGMLTWLGSWFTQFFYHPWMGVTLLCGWWLLLLLLLKKTFAVSARWSPLLLIPVALLLLTNVDQGYWIYMLKLRGHFFITTIATTAVVAALWVFRNLPDKYWLRCVWMVLVCAIGYPLMGIYGLAATLLMGIWSWRLLPRSRAAIYSLIAVVCAIAVPLLCYRYVYYETNLANIYYAELPLFFITEEYHTYYIPYYLLALFMVIMACLPVGMRDEENEIMRDGENERMRDGDNEKRRNEGKKKASAKSPKSKPFYVTHSSLIICACVLVAMTWAVVHFWYKDENFHHELKMQHLVQQTDWEGVLKEAETQQDEPTRAIVMMRNLALARLGRQSNDMYQYKNGSKRYNAPFDMRLMLVSGTLIYYQYGMLNYCNRLCTELGVEFGWRAEHYQYLASCALLNGDKKVAQKYINILKRTLFFDEWAEWAENLLNNPELIAKERELEPITHMLHYPNDLTGDQGYVERFLMNQLAHSSYPADPIFQEQSLLASLWLKDPKLFWYHFGIYIKQHPNGPMPLVFQEAAYFYGQMEKRPNLDRMPFSQGVKDGFKRFMDASANYEGMDIEEARERMYALYGNTFYYDYYLMSNLPEY